MTNLQRYFIPEQDWNEDNVIVKGQDAHHLARVMRKNIGDHIICNHTKGKAAICEIDKIEKEVVQLHVVEWLEENVELPISVTIAQGLPKGDKLELVLQKGTELGASAFIPFQSKRSVVNWDKRKSEKKIQRFKKIVKEASEQCHRNQIPDVFHPMSMKQLIEESKSADVKIYAYEEEARLEKFQSFSTIVKKLKKGQNMLVVIGPEGGFAREEAELFNKNGFIPVRLGPRILRTETAALYALASVSYQFEELGCL